METNEIMSACGNAGLYVLTAVQDNPVFQTITLILSIITSIVLLAYRIWKWWKEAKKDGKITKEEIKDGIDIVASGVKDIVDKTKKGEKDGQD